MCPAPGPSGGERVFRRPKVASSLMLRTHRFCTNDKFILKKGARPFAFKWPLQLELHQDVRSGVSGADSVRPGALRPARRRGGLSVWRWIFTSRLGEPEPRSRNVVNRASHCTVPLLLPLCVDTSQLRHETGHMSQPSTFVTRLLCPWPPGVRVASWRGRGHRQRLPRAAVGRRPAAQTSVCKIDKVLYSTVHTVDWVPTFQSPTTHYPVRPLTLIREIRPGPETGELGAPWSGVSTSLSPWQARGGAAAVAAAQAPSASPRGRAGSPSGGPWAAFCACPRRSRRFAAASRPTRPPS